MATSQGGQTSRPIFVHNNYSQPKNNKLAQFVVILVQAPKLYVFEIWLKNICQIVFVGGTVWQLPNGSLFAN